MCLKTPASNVTRRQFDRPCLLCLPTSLFHHCSWRPSAKPKAPGGAALSDVDALRDLRRQQVRISREATQQLAFDLRQPRLERLKRVEHGRVGELTVEILPQPRIVDR